VGTRLIRGGVARRWYSWKSDRVAARYRQLILGSNRVIAPAPRRPAASRTLLRRLLFICENMWEERELLPELEKLCTVRFIGASTAHRKAARPADERIDVGAMIKLLEPFKQESFDLVLVYLHSPLLSDELLGTLRRTWKCPLAGMNLDDKTTYLPSDVYKSWAGNYRAWAGKFDFNLTNSAAMMDVYRAHGHQCVYLPTGFHYDPAIHRCDPPATFAHQLSFVGSWKPERAEFIGALRGCGIPIALYGGGWEGGQFTNEGWKVFRNSQMSLGISFNLPGTQFTNLKNRDFECPGAGGCYLTTYDWELANLLTPGKEILCYRNITDFAEQYSWYSRRPDVCRAIAAAGHLRCINEHTWAKRFETALGEVGFSFQKE
jgi:hypothetical protein